MKILIYIIIILLLSISCFFINNNYQEIDMNEFLKKYKNQEIIYIPNGGNGGDALIAAGTMQLFDKHKIKYTIKDNSEKYNNKILFYGGGGNLIKKYNYCKNFLDNNINNNNKIIILPHTIFDVDEYIKKFNDNVIVICREKKSYNYVYSKIKNKNNLFLSKDMAFHLDVSKYKNISGKGTLNYFRTDKEKNKNMKIKLPDDNIDLSAKINYDSLMTDKKKVFKTAYEILDKVSEYEYVNTDRLHGSIAGSLLNKKVKLYPNNYYKNKEVFKYSLKNNFKNTQFIK